MQEARTCNFTLANFSLHHLMITFSATSQITFKRSTEEFPGRSLQIWGQLQVFALFRRAVRNMASVEKEVPFKPKMTETCVSTQKKKNAICHDAMFCRPAAQLQLNQTSSSILSVLKASLTRQLEDLSQDKGEGHPRSRRSYAGSSDMQLYVGQLFVTPSDDHIFSYREHIQKTY